MHRIPALLASSNEMASHDESPATMVSSYPCGTYRNPAEAARRLADDLFLDTEFPHRLFLPHNFTPSYNYPLVVWLHSGASSEMELDSVMESLSDQNYIAVAPRANIRSSTKQQLFQWENGLCFCRRGCLRLHLQRDRFAARTDRSCFPRRFRIGRNRCAVDRTSIFKHGGWRCLNEWCDAKPRWLIVELEIISSFTRFVFPSTWLIAL
jgi:hypothetical protein